MSPSHRKKDSADPWHLLQNIYQNSRFCSLQEIKSDIWQHANSFPPRHPSDMPLYRCVCSENVMHDCCWCSCFYIQFFQAYNKQICNIEALFVPSCEIKMFILQKNTGLRWAPVCFCCCVTKYYHWIIILKKLLKLKTKHLSSLSMLTVKSYSALVLKIKTRGKTRSFNQPLSRHCHLVVKSQKSGDKSLNFFYWKILLKRNQKQKRHLKLQQYPLVLQTPSDSQFERHGRQVTKQIKK